MYMLGEFTLYQRSCELVFGFIECYMTVFLHTHSWLSWVDEDDDDDEVGS